MTDLSKNIEALREKKAVIEMGGGEAAIEKQVAMGKLTARERILALLDKNSFHEPIGQGPEGPWRQRFIQPQRPHGKPL